MEQDKLKMVRTAVAEGIEDALIKLGITHDYPHEMQKDFAYLRQSRLSRDNTTNRIKIIIVSAAGSAVLMALWNQLKFLINS